MEVKGLAVDLQCCLALDPLQREIPTGIRSLLNRGNKYCTNRQGTDVVRCVCMQCAVHTVGITCMRCLHASAACMHCAAGMYVVHACACVFARACAPVRPQYLPEVSSR